jgi:hypothetical protein
MQVPKPALPGLGTPGKSPATRPLAGRFNSNGTHPNQLAHLALFALLKSNRFLESGIVKILHN